MVSMSCVVERVGRCTAVSSSCLISPAETDMLAHLILVVWGCLDVEGIEDVVV